MLRRSVASLSAVPATAASNCLRPADQQRTLAQALREHNEQGTDLAARLTSEFVSIQVQLLKYRVVRFNRELMYLKENPSAGIPAWYAIPFHLIALFVVMQLGWMTGRMDIQPLERPPVAA